MRGYLSCFDGMFRGWGKLIGANGVAVVMVDFRNAVVPSSVPEVGRDTARDLAAFCGG